MRVRGRNGQDYAEHVSWEFYLVKKDEVISPMMERYCRYMGVFLKGYNDINKFEQFAMTCQEIMHV